jgi:hypothetical protein
MSAPQGSLLYDGNSIWQWTGTGNSTTGTLVAGYGLFPRGSNVSNSVSSFDPPTAIVAPYSIFIGEPIAGSEPVWVANASGVYQYVGFIGAPTF